MENAKDYPVRIYCPNYFPECQKLSSIDFLHSLSWIEVGGRLEKFGKVLYPEELVYTDSINWNPLIKERMVATLCNHYQLKRKDEKYCKGKNITVKVGGKCPLET